MTTTSAALVPIQPAFTDAERLALAGFLAGYRGLTREAYALDLRQFTTWCRSCSVALFAVRRADIESFARDLEVSQRPASEMGMGELSPPGSGFTAESVKEMHTRLADLTNDELRSINIIPTGTRLEEGAQYIDLNHLERGAFVADARMVAGPEHYYVAKKATGYVLWNRLNQVENPARLDEAGPPTT